MENQQDNQLELFSQSGDVSLARHDPQRSLFLARIRRYERAVLIIIGIIITGLASFSLGVERGKQGLPKPIQAAPLPLSTAAAVPKVKEPVGNYTIQLASYKSKALAQKEAQDLKRKGLTPALFSKGSYTVLCVGSFSTKQEALNSLSELRRRYVGCYVRRL